MKKRPIVALINLCLGLAWPVCTPGTARAVSFQEKTPAVFFDVLDLPARIDAPTVGRKANGYVLSCALANRSGEQLVGLRLTLLIVESAGRVRTIRTTWNEAAEVPAYSIKTFEFHPIIKDEMSKNATLFLGIDDVIGRETIWRTVDADKLLRAYARGQHDLVPKVQSFANKFDPRARAILIPLEEQE
ncbi:MAG: hypothetical protein ABR607_09945 [Pyrinomonadaceae bacterium]